MKAEEFIRQYQEEQLKKEVLPEELGAHFELLACIHVTEMHVSLLMLNKETSEKYILKRGVVEQMGSLNIEKEQLERIGKLAGQSELELKYWMEDGREYLLRKYIEGQNLEEYLERHPVPGITEVMDIAIQICRILNELHKMQPPIIHRDIKPQNIILDRYGTVHLIDFETSRNFDEHKQKDTRFYGTDITAAPEQYGYAQTDARTDIYAFGKVLCYLLTGDYQVETCRQKSGRLYSIVAKCCAFDPKKRYQTIAEVEKILLKEKKRNEFGGKKKLRNILGYASIAALVFMAGIFVGRGMIWKRAETLVQEEVREQLAQQALKGSEQESSDIIHAGEQSEETGEDLLYRAAAVSLHKETVTEEDFKNIFCIAVIGTNIYDITENFEMFELNAIIYHDEDYVCNSKWANGTITDISMLGKMENLSEVYLYNQNITNIDVLEGLPIRKLYLSGNKIEDFRVLEKLPQLEELCITKNPIRYLPDFSKCPKLKSLIMNENMVTDLDSLRNSSVEQMSIRKLHVAKGDYTFLEEMPELTKLLVWNPDSEMAEEITHLTNLKHLEILDYRRANLDFLVSLQSVEVLNLHLVYTQDLSPLEKMSNLHELCISNVALEDISVIRNIKNLQFLNINETIVTDLSPVLDCKKLKQIIVNEKQSAYLTEHDENHSYSIDII